MVRNDILSHFRSIEELVKMLDREKVLFRDMFERRKSLAYRKEFALEVVDYRRERIQYLIDHGVIHENGDFLEMEDVYVRFFEDVLDMNEEISVASVREYIDLLRENINYYLQETNEHRKYQYQGNVRKILRKIGLRTLKNVVDLKRNVDVAFKQEPNYKIKMSRLTNLDEKRKGVKVLMQECEKMLDGEVVFFKTRSLAADACKNGRVSINNVNVKPSHMVKVGDTVNVRKPPVTYSFKILKTIEQRVGAKLIPEIYENVTSPDQYELLEMNRISGFVDRARGTGRPTKKERRALDAFIGPTFEKDSISIFDYLDE